MDVTFTYAMPCVLPALEYSQEYMDEPDGVCSKVHSS